MGRKTPTWLDIEMAFESYAGKQDLTLIEILKLLEGVSIKDLEGYIARRKEDEERYKAYLAAKENEDRLE